MSFRWITLFLFVGLARALPAPTIEIVYRPSLFGVAGVAPSPAIYGHVAIRLPPGARPGGTIFGWQPVEATSARFSWLLGDSDNPRTTPGRFAVNDAWAIAGAADIPGRTMSFAIEVTDAELRTIVGNMARMEAGSSYQMLPHTIPGTRGYVFPENGANCVVAIQRILRGTSVRTDFVPSSGSIGTMVQNVRARATPWDFCSTSMQLLE